MITIGQLAAHAGVTVKAVRHYHKAVLVGTELGRTAVVVSRGDRPVELADVHGVLDESGGFQGWP
jgi:hypothetical protein